MSLQEKEFSLSYSNESTIDFHICQDPELNWLSTFECDKFKRFFIVIDENVDKIWGEKIFTQLDKHSKDKFVMRVPAEENSKSINYYLKVVEFLEARKCGRFDLVIGIGGGIILDLVSFTASIYMRGLAFYAVPTTIIGQVDAITAGKTCLNTNNS